MTSVKLTVADGAESSATLTVPEAVSRARVPPWLRLWSSWIERHAFSEGCLLLILIRVGVPLSRVNSRSARGSTRMTALANSATGCTTVG
jgi:hypothetical protein